MTCNLLLISIIVLFMGKFSDLVLINDSFIISAALATFGIYFILLKTQNISNSIFPNTLEVTNE